MDSASTDHTASTGRSGPGGVTPAFYIGLGSYLSVIVAGAVVFAIVDDPPRWVGVLIAVLAGVCATGMFVALHRWVRGSEGIERIVYIDSAGFAFIATMLAALTYTFLEAFAGFPTLSMVTVFFFGMVVWGVDLIVRTRKLR